MNIKDKNFNSNIHNQKTSSPVVYTPIANKSDTVSFSGKKKNQNNGLNFTNIKNGISTAISYTLMSSEEKQRFDDITKIRSNLCSLERDAIDKLTKDFNSEMMTILIEELDMGDNSYSLYSNTFKKSKGQHSLADKEYYLLKMTVDFLKKYPPNKEPLKYDIASYCIQDCGLTLKEIDLLFTNFYVQDQEENIKNAANSFSSIKNKYPNIDTNLIFSMDVNQLKCFDTCLKDKELFDIFLKSAEIQLKEEKTSTATYYYGSSYYKSKEISIPQEEILKEALNQLKNFVTEFYDEEQPSKFETAKWCIVNCGKSIEETKKLFEISCGDINKVKYEAQNRHQVTEQIINSLFIPETICGNEELKKELIDSTTFRSYSFSDVIDMIGTSISSGKYDLTDEDLIALFTECNEKIEKYLDPNAYNNSFGYIQNIDYHGLKLELFKNRFSDLIAIVKENPMNNDETSLNYFNRITTIYNEKQSKLEKDNKIKENLVFSEVDTLAPDNKIELTTEEKQILVDNINKQRKGLEHYDIEDDMSTLANAWASLYVSGGMPINSTEDTKIANACLQEMPRYIPGTRNKDPYAPVCRWMHFALHNGDYENFINSLPEEGEILNVDRIQSCSKNLTYAENEFRDNNPNMKVKYIIYPKSKVSKAADIGAHKYGNNEVIYPAGTKFKVLHKGIEEYELKNYDHNESGSIARYCVYLQEV